MSAAVSDKMEAAIKETQRPRSTLNIVRAFKKKKEKDV